MRHGTVDSFLGSGPEWLPFLRTSRLRILHLGRLDLFSLSRASRISGIILSVLSSTNPARLERIVLHCSFTRPDHFGFLPRDRLNGILCSLVRDAPRLVFEYCIDSSGGGNGRSTDTAVVASVMDFLAEAREAGVSVEVTTKRLLV